MAAKSAINRSTISLVRNQAWIGSSWTNASGGKTFPVYDPGTGQKIVAVSDTGADDARRAIAEAYKAQKMWGTSLGWVSNGINYLLCLW